MWFCVCVCKLKFTKKMLILSIFTDPQVKLVYCIKNEMFSA